jgi:hypothetical protein
LWSHVNADGKIKVMKKERRSEEKVNEENRFFISESQAAFETPETFQ